MKFLRLITKNIGRNKRRTILTILSVALTVFLLATMQAIITAFDAMGEANGSEQRVIVRRNTSLADAMPEAYEQKIAQIPGVAAITPANWFGGIYKDERFENFVAQFYVTPRTLFDVHPEFILSESEKAAFISERTATIVSEQLAQKHGWKIGDVIELRGTRYPVDPRLTVRGIYKAPVDAGIFFHRQYIEEALGRPGDVGTYRVKIDSPDTAPRVMAAIDGMFENSSAPTKTETEAAFALGFVSMLGNVKGFITSIGLAVVFTITLISGNTMAMSGRERVTEIAVMKALGFGKGLILSLILAEAVLIATVGGAIAVIAAKLVYKFVRLGEMIMFLQDFEVQNSTILIALAMSALIGLVSGGVPAFNAARIKIVDGLRRVA